MAMATGSTAGVAEEWDAVAAAWEDFHDYTEASVAPVTERLLACLALQPGDEVLELGPGVGALGAAAAELVAPTGRVIVSDVAPGMVAAARRRLAGVPNVDVLCLDGQAIELDDDSVDAVVCRMGFMLMPEPMAAFAEANRVLRDDGRFVFSVWSGPQDNAWAMCLGMSVAQAGLEPPADPFGPGRLFSLSDPDRVRRLLEEIGFGKIDIHEVDCPHLFSDVDAYWTALSQLAGPVTALLAQAPPAKVAEVRSHVVALADQFRVSEGFCFPGRALVVTAS